MTKAMPNHRPGNVTAGFDDTELTQYFEWYTNNQNKDGFDGTPDKVLPPTP